MATGFNESKQFLDVFLNYNFTQVIDKPTSGENIFDLRLTTTPKLFKSVEYVQGLSDHKLINIKLSFIFVQ